MLVADRERIKGEPAECDSDGEPLAEAVCPVEEPKGKGRGKGGNKKRKVGETGAAKGGTAKGRASNSGKGGRGGAKKGGA